MPLFTAVQPITHNGMTPAGHAGSQGGARPPPARRQDHAAVLPGQHTQDVAHQRHPGDVECPVQRRHAAGAHQLPDHRDAVRLVPCEQLGMCTVMPAPAVLDVGSFTCLLCGATRQGLDQVPSSSVWVARLSHNSCLYTPYHPNCVCHCRRWRRFTATPRASGWPTGEG